MGDIADMMLEGILDAETGEYIGDINLADYGTKAPGFPRSLEGERRQKIEEKRNAPKSRLYVNCPICNKKCKVAGIADHCRNQHGVI